MRFEFFRQIVGRIRNDIPCPRCGIPFDEQTIEVVAAGPQNIEFIARCPQCGTRAGISAQIELTRVHQAVRPISSHPRISFENVQQISESLKRFSGRDVRDLFQK